jgi:glycosyltransferase involved in cell wall biosynthesis
VTDFKPFINKLKGGRRCLGIKKVHFGEQPFVSIITAVYNGNYTIDETIKSVISQDYPNFEYIVVDGGSTDGTVETLRKYDESIDYWVSEPDKGVYDALNKGIVLAQGEWLYFIGADDRFKDKQVVSRMIGKHPQSRLLYGNVYAELLKTNYDGEFSKYKLCLKNICQQAIFYHKKLFDDLGNFNTKYKLFADWEFNIRCFANKNTNPIFVDSTVAYYSSTGLSSKYIDEKFEQDKLSIIKNILGFKYYFYTTVRMSSNKIYCILHSILHRYLSNVNK